MLMTGLIALLALVLGLSIGCTCGYGLGYSERAKRGKEMWKFYHAGRQSGLAEEPQEAVVYHYHKHGGLIKEEKTIRSLHTRLDLNRPTECWETTETEDGVKPLTEQELLAALEEKDATRLHAESQHTGRCDGAAEYQAANPSKTFTGASLKILEGSRDERLEKAGANGWMQKLEQFAQLAPSKT